MKKEKEKNSNKISRRVWMILFDKYFILKISWNLLKFFLKNKTSKFLYFWIPKDFFINYNKILIKYHRILLSSLKNLKSYN